MAGHRIGSTKWYLAPMGVEFNVLWKGSDSISARLRREKGATIDRKLKSNHEGSSLALVSRMVDYRGSGNGRGHGLRESDNDKQIDELGQKVAFLKNVSK